MTAIDQRAIRPAGAPMVPMERPSEASSSHRDDSGTASLAGEAREAAERMQGQAREIATERVADLSSDLARRVSEYADDLRAVARELDDRGRGGGARVAEQVGTHVDRAGEYLDGADLDRLTTDVQSLLRRRPLVAAAGVVAAGVVVGRLIRASAESTQNGGTR